LTIPAITVWCHWIRSVWRRWFI